MASREPAGEERRRRIVVRDARPGDARALAELHVATWQSAYRELLDERYLAELSVDERERAWHERLAIAPGLDHFSLVAADPGPPGHLAGFATGGGSRDADRKGYGELYAIYVAPDRSRAGIGTALVASGEARLAEAGFTAATLWVLEGNVGARAFYERLGWRPDGCGREILLGPSRLVELRYARPC